MTYDHLVQTLTAALVGWLVYDLRDLVREFRALKAWAQHNGFKVERWV